MHEVTLPKGWSAQEAVTWLLERRSVECPPNAVRNDLNGRDGMDAVVEFLRQRDIGVRSIKIPVEDLVYVGCPTLLWIDGHGWYRLEGDPGGAKTFAGADGRPVPIDRHHAEVHALDLTPGFPRHGTMWQRLIPVILAHRKPMGQMLALAIGFQLLGLVTPQIGRVVMDQAIPNRAMNLLVLLSISTVAANLFSSLIGWYRSWIILGFQTQIQNILQRGFLEHTLRLPFLKVQGKDLGTFMQSLGAFDSAKSLIMSTAIGAFLDAGSFVVYFVILVSMFPGPTLVMMIASVVIAAATVLIGRQQIKVSRRALEASILEKNYQYDLLGGIATIKAAGVERKVQGRWLAKAAKVMDLTLLQDRIGLLTGAGVEFISGMVSLVVLIWGGKLVLDGGATLGELTAFQMMAATLNGSISSLTGAYLNLLGIRPQVERAKEILEVEQETKRHADRLGLDGVRLEEVWFRYAPSAPWILEAFDLSVAQGEHVWIQGPSGGGKSTLLRLVSGLLSAERGQVRVGEMDAAAIQGAVGYLPQFTRLYDGIVMESLKILSGRAPTDRILAYAEMTGLDAYLRSLPMGYKTIVPSGGGNFSGGQRQLIGLTAALASEKRILLLDEPMANIDWGTKRRILSSGCMDGRTILYASHDVGFGPNDRLVALGGRAMP